MREFKPQDLKYHYEWTPEFKQKRHISITTDDYIDRKNGYHILDFINNFLHLHGLFSVSSLHRLEKLICKYMPEKINTRAEMKTWIGQNWNKHFN